MLKIMQLLVIARGHMSINILLYESRLNLMPRCSSPQSKMVSEHRYVLYVCLWYINKNCVTDDDRTAEEP